MLNLPNKPYHVLQKFLQENDQTVYWYMVLSISNAIQKKYERAKLFSFGIHNENIAMVRQSDYEKVLIDAMGIFVKEEKYEHAAYARDVLQKWKIEQVLNEKPTE